MASQAHAAEAAAAKDGGAADAGGQVEDKQNQVVVTGSTSLKRTVRESSVAVTVAEREDLDRKAPRSMASALELIPGMMVEDSGGEASNNFSVRGLAGGGEGFRVRGSGFRRDMAADQIIARPGVFTDS